MLLRTSRLIISDFSYIDISSEYIGWLNSPETMRFSNQRFIQHTEESCKKYLIGFKNTENSFLKITEIEEKKMIGTATIYINKHHQRADIGLLISKEYWGMGYGREAWNAIIENLKKARNIQKLTTGTAAINIAMQKIIQSSGFLHEATLKNHEIIDGDRIDIYYYCQFTQNV